MPEISVVMSVYNDERYLSGGVDSILSQKGVDFEFIIIDDGSTDSSSQILAEYEASDSRIRIIHQENAGLTKALIKGCAEAKGKFIARQDADDISLPGRLTKLAENLRRDSSLVFVSSWAEVIGPENEVLFLIQRPSDSQAATDLLLKGRQGPPGHGSVMFRRDIYEQVGGYRPEFYYAQDSDLWLRMGSVGPIAYVPEVLYRYRISEVSMSGNMHQAKLPFAKLVDDCYAERTAGRSEKQLLEKGASLIHDLRRERYRGDSKSDTLYFIGNCLLRNKDRRAVKYFQKCIQCSPVHLRAWSGIVRSFPLLFKEKI